MNKSLCTRALVLLLIIALTCPLFAACESNTVEGTVVSDSSGQSVAEESRFNDEVGFHGYEIPEGIDYGGRTVRVLTMANYQVKPESDPTYSEETTTAVKSAAAECTRKVEQLLNIEVEEEGISTGSRYGGPFYQRVCNDAISDTADYLFIMPALTEAAMLASDGLLYDMNNVVNLDNPWWCDEFNDAATIAGRNYFISGDITTIALECTMFVAFNKVMEKKYGLAKKYGYNSLYEMADDNAWTQDVFFEMAKSVYADSNENNKVDPADITGMSAQHNVIYWLLRSADIHVCELDPDGYPTLTVNNERAIDLITKAQEYCQDPVNGLLIGDDYLDSGEKENPAGKAFLDGRCLFLFTAVGSLNTVRTMEDDFGVLPCPKYDELQENYSCNVGAWTSNCIAIPTSVDESELELATHFLESLGAVSLKELTPTFYEQTLQYQISRDDESMRMLDIISKYRAPDLSEMYRWGNMMQTIADLRQKPVGTFTSAYDAIDEVTIIEIEETVDRFKNNTK